ncbi:alanine racemase, partial [bacterium]|nr:alanine racemase [bacterium]
MKNLRQSNISIHRDSWVEINLENVAHNIKELKKTVPENKKILAVVKADAYGHGAVMLAPTLLASGCDMLGVASIDEGLDLRNAKINCKILVLGAIPVWAIENAVYSDISFAVFSDEHLNACKQIFERTGIKPKVHVKLDTGMNRIGINPKKAVEFINKVRNSDFVDLEGIFTHFYEAENLESAQKQIDLWASVISQIDTKNLILHAQNTTGSLCYEVP